MTQHRADPESQSDAVDSTPPATPQLVSVKRAAELLAISERLLFALTASGKLPRVQLGRAVRYDLADLAVFVEAAKRGGP